jgi:hypothetical protein
MGDGMSSEFERLIAERKLIRARIGRGMIEKEIEAAESDLKDARDSLERRRTAEPRSGNLFCLGGFLCAYIYYLF